MNVTELIRETDKLSPAERADFEREWLSRWHPEYETRRQEIGRKLAEGAAAGRRGDFIEATPQNLDKILTAALSEAAARRERTSSCPA